MTATTTDQDRLGSPAYLVAIARAARLTGDRLVETEARRRLRYEWGIDITFNRKRVMEDIERLAKHHAIP